MYGTDRDHAHDPDPDYDHPRLRELESGADPQRPQRRGHAMSDRDPLDRLIEAEERLAGERPPRPIWPEPGRMALLGQLRDLYGDIGQRLEDEYADRQYTLEQVADRLYALLRENGIDPDATEPLS